jgi:hypothetical protein
MFPSQFNRIVCTTYLSDERIDSLSVRIELFIFEDCFKSLQDSDSFVINMLAGRPASIKHEKNSGEDARDPVSKTFTARTLFKQ